MRISEVLRKKGTDVMTVGRRATVAELLEVLATHNIGALVVVEDAEIVGIVSERDVVRRLARHGSGLLAEPVASIMTEAVVACTPEDTVDDLTLLMTERRIRHIPVIAGGDLAGLVSIGDVVKSRIDQLEHHRRHLENYITQG